MKKIFYILTLSLSLCLLSGCFYVAAEPKIVVTPVYDISCYNNTDITVTDWCVKRNDLYTYANSDYNCAIFPHHTDYISDLPAGEYQIFFTFKNRRQLHDFDYEETGTFYLDEDVTFYVAQRNIYGDRAAGSNEQTGNQSKYVLICSNGQEYELTPCN